MRLFGRHPPEHAALLLEDGRMVNYAELEQAVMGIAPDFGVRGVAFLLCNNDFPSLACYLAALEAGAVPLLLPGAIASTQLQALIEAYAPRYIVHDRDDVRQRGHGRVVRSIEGYDVVACTAAADTPLHPSLGLLLATSGSTGSPKLVRLSHGNLLANADSIIEYLGISPKERAITSLPMHYSYGLSVIHTHLRAGATLALTDSSLMQGAFWKALRRNEVTSMAGVPYTYDILLRLRLERLDVPTLRTLTQAGGRLDPVKIRLVEQACATKGIRFFTMYGQTEATARISYLPAALTAAKAGSIGGPVPGGRMWLEHDDGSQIRAPGATGELVYAGANVCLGYAQGREGLARGDDFGGVLHTGDMATVDGDGHYSIVGRRNRFLKVFGVRICLDTIEELLAGWGLQAAATGNDEQLVVGLACADPAEAEAVRTRLAGTLSLHQSALTVRALAALPRLPSGKVDYQGLA
jgi:acyl-coenzyme A synthetase/AMP-(fatty) acid ligase